MEEEQIKEISKVVERIMNLKEEDLKRTKDKEQEQEQEKFECPECSERVRTGQLYCGGCGVELEWED